MQCIPYIEANPSVMGGKPCIKGTRVTVGTIVGMLGSGVTMERLLDLYPYLNSAQIMAALQYAAWRSEEIELAVDRLTA